MRIVLSVICIVIILFQYILHMSDVMHQARTYVYAISPPSGKTRFTIVTAEYERPETPGVLHI
jgi:hypothetical protein